MHAPFLTWKVVTFWFPNAECIYPLQRILKEDSGRVYRVLLNKFEEEPGRDWNQPYSPGGQVQSAGTVDN